MQNQKTLIEAIKELKDSISQAKNDLKTAKAGLAKLGATLSKCENLEIVKAHDALMAKRSRLKAKNND